MKTTAHPRSVKAKRLSVVLALLAATRSVKLHANPQGMSVGSGTARARQNGSRLDVTVGPATFLDWSSFDIQSSETTRFIQPNSSSIVFNNIGGSSPSQIWGHLTANGTVILANARGFYFGPNSVINVGGSFIATTAPLAPDAGAGAAWQFSGMPPLASIVNYGQILVGEGKSLYLIAEKIENHGGLNAPGGDIGLYAGKEVWVSDRPDGRGLSATVKLPRGSVDNFGQITADAGAVSLQAQVVNQNGIIQADSVRDHNGVIELVASDSLNLGANSQILARGDNASQASAGGTVRLKSGTQFAASWPGSTTYDSGYGASPSSLPGQRRSGVTPPMITAFGCRARAMAISGDQYRRPTAAPSVRCTSVPNGSSAPSSQISQSSP